MKHKIYLDDLRTPEDTTWVVVRSYEEFCKTIDELGIENIDLISFDHDLGKTAMDEYYNNVKPNYHLDYNNIEEKTGYDCAKYLVNKCLDENITYFPSVIVHSANPIGSANIMGYLNNYLKNTKREEMCVWHSFPFKMK